MATRWAGCSSQRKVHCRCLVAIEFIPSRLLFMDCCVSFRRSIRASSARPSISRAVRTWQLVTPISRLSFAR